MLTVRLPCSKLWWMKRDLGLSKYGSAAYSMACKSVASSDIGRFPWQHCPLLLLVSRSVYTTPTRSARIAVYKEYIPIQT